MEALAALPASSEINPNTIDDLKKQNMHQLADSLANVKRMLDSADFTLNMMAGFTSMASDFGNTGKSANEGAAAIQNAIASKPRTTPTYKAPRAFMAAPIQWVLGTIQLLQLAAASQQQLAIWQGILLPSILLKGSAQGSNLRAPANFYSALRN